MKNQLQGKIYWVLEDFSFNGNYYPKKDETAHATTKINNVIVDENMIKFITEPIDYSGTPFSYNVNLLVNDNGLTYSGKFSETKDGDLNGLISCELFENKKGFFIYGKWNEYELEYTWWARINKDNNK